MALASPSAFAQAPNGGATDPVLGIVEIPEMFTIDQQTGQRAPIAALTLYTRPDLSGGDDQLARGDRP
jgi:hypothetical protein